MRFSHPNVPFSYKQESLKNLGLSKLHFDIYRRGESFSPFLKNADIY
jgi:hypothetical protein